MTMIDDRHYDRCRIVLPPGWRTAPPGSLSVEVLFTHVRWGRLQMLFIAALDGTPLGVLPAMYLQETTTDDPGAYAAVLTSRWDELPHDPATVAALINERNKQNKKAWEVKS